MRGLDLPGHLRDLVPDHPVLDQVLAERLALVGVVQGFLVADAAVAVGVDADEDALVVALETRGGRLACELKNDLRERSPHKSVG